MLCGWHSPWRAFGAGNFDRGRSACRWRRAFQKNARQNAGKFQKSGGAPFFVSHNMPAVLQLTTRGIVLDKGRVRSTADGRSGGVPRGIARTDSQVSFPSKIAAKASRNRASPVCFIPVRPRDAGFFRRRKIFILSQKSARMRMCPNPFQHDRFHDGRRACGHLFRRGTSGLRCAKKWNLKFPFRIRGSRRPLLLRRVVGKGDYRTAQVDFDTVLDLLAFEVRPKKAMTARLPIVARLGSGHFTGLGISPGSSSHPLQWFRENNRKCFRKFQFNFYEK